MGRQSAVRMASTVPGVDVTAASASGSESTAPSPANAGGEEDRSRTKGSRSDERPKAAPEGRTGWGGVPLVRGPSDTRTTPTPCTCCNHAGDDGNPPMRESSSRLACAASNASPQRSPRLNVSNGDADTPAPRRSVVNPCTPAGAGQSACSSAGWRTISVPAPPPRRCRRAAPRPMPACRPASARCSAPAHRPPGGRTPASRRATPGA